ncbi:hypothetical protein Hanom_Chr02g00146041 [Helianthus anomalus]
MLVDQGARISGSASIVWRKKIFKIWVSEESEDWIPDCMLEEERVKKVHESDEVAGQNVEDGIKGEESSDEEGEGVSVRSENVKDDYSEAPGNELSDGHPPAMEYQQSDAVYNGGGSGFDRCVNAWGINDAPGPKEGGNSDNRDGDHWVSKEVNCSPSNGNHFNLGRSTKHSRRPRPRSKKQACGANVSPTSDPRPRKRIRENQEFSFDLNYTAGVSCQNSPSKCDLSEASTNRIKEHEAVQVCQVNTDLFSKNPVAGVSRSDDRGDQQNIEE